MFKLINFINKSKTSISKSVIFYIPVNKSFKAYFNKSSIYDLVHSVIKTQNLLNYKTILKKYL